jgi:nudix-type nucleoside diphosphatase (YffH/AdpP family)
MYLKALNSLFVKKGHIRNIRKKLLSRGWSTLESLTFDYKTEDGSWEKQTREVYDRGNGAAILLFNSQKNTVVLTRQFRMPTYVNGNEDGMMIEVCAGLLDSEDPAECIRREVEEETGYSIAKVQLVMQTYMSPGSVSEILYLFTGEYNQHMKTGEGGGAEGESENIEVLEFPFEKALHMVASGEIKDAKTILLLQYAAIKGIFGLP